MEFSGVALTETFDITSNTKFTAAEARRPLF
jgi:hypothetical protein